jgi:hypothetical protein
VSASEKPLEGENMKTLLWLLSLSAAGLATPMSVLAQHDHGPAAIAATAGVPTGRPAGRPAAREWTKQPLLIGRAERGDRASAKLTLRGLAAANVTVYAAEGPAERLKTEYPVGPEGARIEAVTPKIGNYHWVVAREESADAVRVASTAWYFGNPGDSPKDMLQAPKHELEIVPAPLPREHRSYREAEKWRFLVRLNGQALAGHAVGMETEPGSRSTVMTDASGHATVVFPRDFKPAANADGEGNDARSRSRFVLVTEKEEGGKRYLTAFNYTYSQDPDRNRSLAWGAAFGILGMVAATPLLRRRQQNEGANGNA